MPNPTQHYVVLETYIDQDGQADSSLLYAGTSWTEAEGAVRAFDGQEAYHEDTRAQVSIQSYPDRSAADGLVYASLEERGHKLFWRVQVASD